MATDLKTLIANAFAKIKSCKVHEAQEMLNLSDHVFVDVREPTEVETDGLIPGAVNVPRGMLEFVLDSSSPYHNSLFASGKSFVFYCKSGSRSALAAQRAVEMGLENVINMRGGYLEWVRQSPK